MTDMHISDQKVIQKILKLAEIKDIDATEAIAQAVENELTNMTGRRLSDDRVHYWKDRLSRNRRERQGSRTYEEIMDELYDENGLPH